MPRDDVGVQRQRLQAATVPPPVLRESPVPVPARTDVGRRSEKARMIELERIARTNLRAAEEAREQLLEHHRKLEQAAAHGSRLASEKDVLQRELAERNHEDGRRRAQLKADATREARKQVAGELDELALEVERLRDALAEHDALRSQHHSRLRDDSAERA
jgi:hypothetical protein